MENRALAIGLATPSLHCLERLVFDIPKTTGSKALVTGAAHWGGPHLEFSSRSKTGLNWILFSILAIH